MRKFERYNPDGKGWPDGGEKFERYDADGKPVTMGGGGGGDVTTASNVGGGAEWFKDLTATILRFRTFISSHLGLVITQNANDITIDLDESAIDHNALDNLTTGDPHTQYTLKSLFDANTILKADSDDTPVALSVPASRIVARLAAGNIVAATVAEIKTLLAYVVADITGAANTALSNLASVAINTSLVSDTDNTDDLGSSAIKWQNVFANRVTLEEVSAPSAPASGDLIAWADVLHNLNIISSLGMISKLLLGEIAASFNATLNTTPVVLFTRTIKANAGGTKGRLRTEIRALIFNNSGASRTYTFSYKFDTYTATFTASLAANATQRTHIEFCIETFWDQAQNAQIHIFSVNNRGPAPAATFGPNTNQGTWETSAITTSGDITVSVELVSNSATATQSGAGVVSQSGPSNN